MRPEVYFVPTAEGVCFLTHKGTEVFRGTSIYGWVERLMPYLDGRHPLDELTAGLSDEKRDMVERTVDALVAKGLARIVDAPGPDNVDHVVDSRFMVLGSGAIFTALTRAVQPCDGADIVLYACDRPEPDRVRELAGRVPLLLHATGAGDEVWIGDGTSWDALWYRLRDRPQWTVSPYLTGAAATLAANQLVLAAQRRVAGVEEAPDTVARLDLTTLRTTTHRVLPLSATAPPDDVPLDDDEFDRRAARLLDPRLGILTEVAEDDLVQVPLSLATVRAAGRAVTAAGPDFRTARLRAALRAVAYHAFVHREAVAVGRALTDGTARRVAVPDDPDGVAAGYDWASAVRTGLLDRCRALTIAQTPPAAPVDLDALPLDDEALGYRRLAEIAGLAVEAYDVTGALRVPTLAFRVGARTVAYTCGLTAADAAREGLELTLLDYQARANNQPRYAPPPVPPLPDRRRTGAVTEPVTLDDAVAAFARDGYTPVAVALDGDPALAGIVPSIVQVVLDRD
jgi:hypothetical protein